MMEWQLDEFRRYLLADATLEAIIRKRIPIDGEDLFGFDKEDWKLCAWEYIIAETPSFEALNFLIDANQDFFQTTLDEVGGIEAYCRAIRHQNGELEPFSGEFIQTNRGFEYHRSPEAIFEVLSEVGQRLSEVAWSWCDDSTWFEDVYGSVDFF